MKRSLRSSSLPQFFACTNSVINPDNLVRVDGEQEAAYVGTDVHSLCESLVKTGEYKMDQLRQRYTDGDFARASLLMRNFHVLWKEASEFIKNPRTEIYLEAEIGDITLTGNLDVLDTESSLRKTYILDYKTGRQHENHYHQMAGYAYLAWQEQWNETQAGLPPEYEVHVTTVYLEDLTITNYVFTPASLTDWASSLEKQAEQLRYTAGRKCAFCSIQGTCPGYRAYTAGALQLFTEDSTLPSSVWTDLTPEQRGQVADKMYVVEKAIDRVKLSLRNQVRSKGPVDIGSNTEYTLVEQEEKHLNTSKALAVLKKKLGPRIVAALARIPLDDVLTAAANRAGKGLKGKAREELFNALDKAGAISRTKTTKMFRRPKGETVLEKSE